MKKLKIIVLFLSVFCFYGCPIEDEGFPIQSSLYEPVTMLRAEFENTTEILPAQPIVNSGKIYIKDHLLFINETYEGFHVFDNSDPSNPTNIAFLKVLGSKDLAIKEDILYVNNSVDLIAIKPNFSNSSIEITKRIKNSFPQPISPDGFTFYVEEDQIIVNWTLIN